MPATVSLACSISNAHFNVIWKSRRCSSVRLAMGGTLPEADVIASGCAAFCPPDDEAFLVQQIEAQALAPFRFQGWLGKRLTASFGFNYVFETAAFAPADPIPG